ncbi:MAG: serine hydrolase, partial [Saprospiraceae bacterium]|nr:serine hydrolase [Saprospiraceae bacterium]
MNIATERLRIDTRPRQREIVLTFIRHSAVFLNMRLRPKKYILLSGLVAAVLIPLTGIGAPAKPKVLTAKAAMVIDADKGTILFKRNPYVRLPAASTVKVLTALMAVKQLDGAATVTISKRAAGISPSKVYLSENKQYKVNDLLSCLLICSANDAGVALAEAMAPSECRFSLQMNAYAKALGAKNSLFLNATGLPEGKQQQYSTVYDLCLFMKKSLRYPLLVKIMETKRMTIAGSDG